MTSNTPPSRLPVAIVSRLRVPVISAPMMHVSGLELVLAVCRAGAVGAFPTLNARTGDELQLWFERYRQAQDRAEGGLAPLCPNFVMRSDRLAADAATCVRNGVEMVITSVGSPAPIIPAMHDGGVLVFADVATLAHARKAIEAGADGLILLSAGAGGQAGWLNPLAFVRAVRNMFDGPLVLAGGISDGVALRAAVTLGCDLAYMGTRFIAAQESLASEAYRRMLVDSEMDGILLTRAFTGLPANFLSASITGAGLDIDNLDESVSFGEARHRYSAAQVAEGQRRWLDVWSAGHTVSAVRAIQTVAEIVEQTRAEFREGNQPRPVPLP